MATRRTAARSTDENGHILHPNPVKPGNPAVLRAQSDDGQIRTNGGISGLSRYRPQQALFPEPFTDPGSLT